MPRRTGHACAVSLCSGVTLTRYCAAHSHLVRASSRTPAKRAFHYLYSRKWKAYSASRLRKYPLCIDPFQTHGATTVAATVTDHVIPHKGDRVLFWNKRNHQSLCASCHGKKSATEEGGRAHTMKRVAPHAHDAASLGVFR